MKHHHESLRTVGIPSRSRPRPVLQPARAALLAFAGLVCFLVAGVQAQDETPAYLDTGKSFEKRTRDLISRLTLEEKGMLLNHRGTTVERFDIRSDEWNQALHGVVWDRPTTMFPVSVAMGATWDPELVHEVATVISDEARAIYNMEQNDPDFTGQRKGLIYRAPVINIGRNPYWGRNEEAYGEDPFLTGRMGVAYVKGLQGDHPRYLKLVSTLKHYAVNNVESDRMSLSASVSERMLHEYWLPHFRDSIVEGNAQSVMASYNAINGVPNNINHLLLTEILKDRWGFEGFVVSDLGGVNTMVSGHEGGQMSFEEAVAKSLIAGCDFSDREFQEYIPVAVRNGMLPIERVDDALYRVLFNRFRLGEFDPDEMVPFSDISPDIIANTAHRELALKAAQKSIVLLGNRDGLLPLNKSEINKIAVIGPHSDLFTPGGYSGRADRPVTPLAGIQNRAGSDIEIVHTQGTPMTDRAGLAVDRESGFSNGASVKLDAATQGEYLEFPVSIPSNGSYEITLHYKTFPSRGQFKLSIDGEDQGGTIDMYSNQTQYDRTFNFGSKELTAGTRTFRFTAVARNPASSAFTGHFDRVRLTGGTEINIEIEEVEYVAGMPEGPDNMATAAALAGEADVAILYLGTSNTIEAEGRDRTSLYLPGRQEELAKAVIAANPKTVVVLMNAGPLTVPWLKDNAPAMLEAWWNGVEGGNAIADVIFGDVNPGGRLPHTVYASEEQVPSQDEYDISKGFTYMYVNGEPLYPFGHGLSYSTFEYSNLKLSADEISTDGELTVSIDVENTGDRAGDEVVQLYVRDLESSVVQPVKELMGFKRVTLSPGEKQTVTLPIQSRHLAFWDELERHDFYVEPGAFEVQVGSSSADIRNRGEFEVVN